MRSVDGQCIYYDGRLAATVTPVGIAFDAWIGALARDDPEWRFVAAAAACAFDVLTGALALPFTNELALAYARGATVGATGFDSTRADGLTDAFPPSTVRGR